mmetsp:Transcript_2089/g.2994  ORF Transcript_2089/g.2994 Transcript_2089/m.2994 type:complete len:186 (-) Transcript_2089:144-701(-)
MATKPLIKAPKKTIPAAPKKEAEWWEYDASGLGVYDEKSYKKSQGSRKSSAEIIAAASAPRKSAPEASVARKPSAEGQVTSKRASVEIGATASNRKASGVEGVKTPSRKASMETGATASSARRSSSEARRSSQERRPAATVAQKVVPPQNSGFLAKASALLANPSSLFSGESKPQQNSQIYAQLI